MTNQTAPTQLRRPWRATARTAFAALVALAAMAPVLVEQTGLDPKSLPWLGGILAGAAAVTRIMALPVVDTFIRRFLPWLAPAPSKEYVGRHLRDEDEVRADEPLPPLEGEDVDDGELDPLAGRHLDDDVFEAD